MNPHIYSDDADFKYRQIADDTTTPVGLMLLVKDGDMKGDATFPTKNGWQRVLNDRQSYIRFLFDKLIEAKEKYTRSGGYAAFLFGKD